MGRKCSVPNCRTGYYRCRQKRLLSNYHSYKSLDKIPVYRFPKDPEKCRQWIEAIPNVDWKVESVTRYMGICQKHFKISDSDYYKKGSSSAPNVPPNYFADLPKPPKRKLSYKTWKEIVHGREITPADSTQEVTTEVGADPEAIKLNPNPDSNVSPASASRKAVGDNRVKATESPSLVTGLDNQPNSSAQTSKSLVVSLDNQPNSCAQTSKSLVVSLDNQPNSSAQTSKSLFVSLDNQPNSSAQTSKSASFMNSILTMALAQPAISASAIEQPLPIPAQTKPRFSIRESSSPGCGPGIKKFVVNMDPEWHSQPHSLSPSPEEEFDEDPCPSPVKLEPGLSLTCDCESSGEESGQDLTNGAMSVRAQGDVEKELDGHCSITANYVLSKLSLLSNSQRILAEKLIADVLFEAEFGNLRQQTKLNILGS